MKYSFTTSNGKYSKNKKNRASLKPEVDLNRLLTLEKPNDLTEFIYEKVIKLFKVSKVVKGGRRYKYCALVVVGDLCARSAAASAKASDAADAVVKAVNRASKVANNAAPINLRKLTYKLIGKYNATKVIIMPTKKGVGVRAGNVVRAIFDSIGISDVSAKVFGSTNAHNVIRAVFNAFEKFNKLEINRSHVWSRKFS
ncbi:MAG: hypothetical protein ACKEQK_00605 [Candidatus Hodgkinia cicadicola]